MAWASVTGSTLSSPLQELMQATEIQPGMAPGYHLCKIIYTDHPLGGKIAEAPVNMALSQAREITVGQGAMKDRLVEAFRKQWEADNVDRVIANFHTLSRVYGIATLALLVRSKTGAAMEDTAKTIDYNTLADKDIAFSIFDPLNTAGSLVLNQNPNDFDFLKPSGAVQVQGQTYHKTRCSVKMNGQPIYLSYTTASFGFVGRSVYQRILFPLKSFVQTMITDDMVTLKAGVIIAKLAQVGTAADNIVSRLFKHKGEKVKEAQTYNVLTVGITESIETLNMQNLDGAYSLARTDVLKNIATGADMSAQLLENETMVAGFGEGTEDAKSIADSINRVRIEMTPTYAFLDPIIMARAWSNAWFEGIKEELPDDLKGKGYDVLFAEWRTSFKPQWPSLISEPDSEKAKADDVKLKAIIALVEVMVPTMDPTNKVAMIQWAMDNVNELKLLFQTGFELDADTLLDFLEEQKTAADEADSAATEALTEPDEPKPEGAAT